MPYLDAYTSSSDFRVGFAEATISNTYGTIASVETKSKLLDKFGTNVDLDAADGAVVVSSLGTNVARPTTNSITHIVGASGDTVDVQCEGHYLDASGNLIFHVQTQTLTEDTPVALDQPLARSSRLKVLGSTAATGPVQTTIGSGGTAVCEVPAGDNQSQKCETSISYRDYWVILNFGAAILVRKSAEVLFRLEVASPGGLWYPLTRDWVLTDANPRAEFPQQTPIIVPANSDVRITSDVEGSTNDVQVTAHMDGYLAIDLDLVDADDPAPA